MIRSTLATASAALILSAGVAVAAPVLAIPTFTWPQPVETPTQSCVDASTLSGPTCIQTGN